LPAFEDVINRKKRSKGHGRDNFCVQSPGDFSIENYTEVFYMIHKRNVLSLQRKTSLDRSTAVRETDGLSFIFIDFYVPAFTRLHCSKAALQLSENITFFAICGT
jgi:hypothetical protein